MSRYPWRNTSEDIAQEAQSQWETPGGAQEKADAAEQAAKDYSDEKLDAHIGTGGAAHANVVAGGAAGFITGPDKTKLDGIASGANNYVHPATHPPSIIAQDVNNRFVTDTEKAEWNAKAPSTLATATTDGLMPATDKDKSNKATNVPTASTLMMRDASGRAQVAAPSATTDIARKAETDAVQANLDNHAGDEEIHVTAADHAKLDGVQVGAEVNQNAFTTINDVSATAKSDTLQLTGGTGVTVTTDPSTKKVTITATGTATPGAHASSHITGGTDVIPNAVTNGSSGLMSGTDAQFVRIEGETKAGAQNKADAALVAANEYTDGMIAAIPEVNDASLIAKGIVMLTNSTNSDSETLVPTAKALKATYDEATAAKQLGVEQKANVVAALNSIGVTASTTETWEQLIAKIAAVIRATGTATVAQVLSGSTFSNVTGNNRTGTMANNGAGGTVTPGTTNQTKAAGYYSSAITISGSANLLAANIKNGVNIFGVVGTLSEGIRYATGVSGIPNSAVPFTKLDGTTQNKYYLQISGIAFKPRIIVITAESTVPINNTTAYPQAAFYSETPVRSAGSFAGLSMTTTGDGDRFYIDGTQAFVTTTGFKLPLALINTGGNFTWYAFE
ncbi:phage tail protein [Paenibacillus sp. FSL P4-0176]|uniref:phage tail protein n=1 Tax=Paenibacillus sp. FSL P4-0176 TaxID=2921631 RepID=UPI0030D23E59